MRFDTPVYFCTQKQTYDYDTGNYVLSLPVEVIRYGSVTDTSVEMLRLVYGSIRQGSKTIRLQNHYEGAFDYIKVGAKKYRVDHREPKAVKDVFVVSEVL